MKRVHHDLLNWKFLNDYDSRPDDQKTEDLSLVFRMLRESYWEINILSDHLEKIHRRIDSFQRKVENDLLEFDQYDIRLSTNLNVEYEE